MSYLKCLLLETFGSKRKSISLVKPTFTKSLEAIQEDGMVEVCKEEGVGGKVVGGTEVGGKEEAANLEHDRQLPVPFGHDYQQWAPHGSSQPKRE
ncbi:hypothetical protein [Absidia glauca]|uniref:Uncharacterized protein n=1 Tax=Absidia glauca TaxID=4829 RepID=A0A168T0I9_ABSGL|nr:hypothetical protein [Absidia glauca]